MNKMRELQILLTKIPKGKVTTYKIVAKKLRIHPRTAGRLLSKNPYPDKYPCYRVVFSDGRVVRKHVKLLRKEGIEIEQGKIDLKRFLFSL
ncbi:MAG: cysteine methyltransferase [Candidatus Aenigmarchaeota archaeon]|nr:cysteine methyltransferase [Candidatus Aenigmarchaeota archaeon]